MKKVLLLIFCTFLVIQVHAQITITVQDMKNQIGKAYQSVSYLSVDVNGIGAILQSPAENQNWSILGRAFTLVDTAITTYLNFPGNAPKTDHPAFNGCNLVVCSYSTYTPNSALWNFYQLTEDKLYILGFVNEDFSGPDMRTHYSPPYLTYVYPLTYGTNWQTQMHGFLEGVEYLNSPIDNKVDGYGTITTPAGTFPCIRMQQKIMTYFEILKRWIVNYNIYFIIQSEDGFFNSSVYVQADSNISPIVVSYSVGHRITAIEKEKTQNSTDFGVTQNFPNPFNSSTVINFTIPRVDHVTIKIFNLAGEELTTIQNGVLSAGRHQIRWQPLDLTSGTYFYRLQTSDLVDTKKLVLIR